MGQPYTATGLDKEKIEYYRGCVSEEVTAHALDANLQVFNPIALTWRADKLREFSDGTFEFYEQLDNRYVDLSSCLVICNLPGWEKSKGLTKEIERFEEQGKPLYILDIDSWTIALFQEGDIFCRIWWSMTKHLR